MINLKLKRTAVMNEKGNVVVDLIATDEVEPDEFLDIYDSIIKKRSDTKDNILEITNFLEKTRAYENEPEIQGIIEKMKDNENLRKKLSDWMLRENMKEKSRNLEKKYKELSDEINLYNDIAKKFRSGKG